MPKQEAKAQAVKLSRAQLRQIPELGKFYKIINDYSLREEAYAAALQAYINIKKKK